MQPEPSLLIGHRAIADFLGISTREVQHLHNQRKLPTWLRGGSPVATAAGLADWQAIKRT